MKKVAIIIVAVITVLVVLPTSLFFALTAPQDKGAFSVGEFCDELENENFQTDKTYNTIKDYKSAAKIGKTAIADRFENANGSIFRWMGCDVQDDEKNDAYYIRTYRLSPFVMGGAYDVIIQSDGTVLAIWGEK